MADDSPEFTARQSQHAQNEKAIRAIQAAYGTTNSQARSALAQARADDKLKALVKALAPKAELAAPVVKTTETTLTPPKLAPVPRQVLPQALNVPPGNKKTINICELVDGVLTSVPVNIYVTGV